MGNGLQTAGEGLKDAGGEIYSGNCCCCCSICPCDFKEIGGQICPCDFKGITSCCPFNLQDIGNCCPCNLLQDVGSGVSGCCTGGFECVSGVVGGCGNVVEVFSSCGGSVCDIISGCDGNQIGDLFECIFQILRGVNI